MSTNKTENYGLHAWVAGDDFLREEINENFAKIDGVLRDKTGVIFGQYVGDGTAERVIALPAPPTAVLLLAEGMKMFDDPRTYGGLALPGIPLTNEHKLAAMTIEGTGFRVYYHASSYSSEEQRTNQTNLRYLYMAIY